jgi:thimet oligopeptidase
MLYEEYVPIRFDYTVEDIKRLTKECIDGWDKLYEKLVSYNPYKKIKLEGSYRLASGPIHFNEAIIPDLTKDEHCYNIYSNISIIKNVHPNKEVREACCEACIELSKYSNELFMRKDIYDAYKQIKELDYDLLGSESKKMLDEIMKGFERNGVHLDKKSRDDIKKTKDELTEKTQQFSKNIRDYEKDMWFTKTELDGLDDMYCKDREKYINDDLETVYKVGLKYPDVIPIFRNCANNRTREYLYSEFHKRGLSEKNGEGNDEILEEILKLRNKFSKLLGYKSYSNYVLSHKRIADKPEKVYDFIFSLIDKLSPKIDNDIENLKTIKRKLNKDELSEVKDDIHIYEKLFLSEKLSEEMFNIDNKPIKEYFQLEYLLTNLFEIYEKMFNVVIRKINVDEKDIGKYIWHKDVKLYAIYNATERKENLFGYFYLDMFPRDGKFSHGAMFPLVSSSHNHDTGNRNKAISAIVTNFTKPDKDGLSLLTFEEVTTFCHEFGHTLHSLMSQTVYSMFAGTSVERDFVECPSMAFENWCYEPEFIKRISKHYLTGKQMPDEMINALKKKKKFNIGLNTLTQLLYSLFDMTIHSYEDIANDHMSEKVWKDIQDKYSPIIPLKGTCFPASFGHLVGYASGYYSYVLAEVYSVAIFQEFKKTGLFSNITGYKYKQSILSTGSVNNSLDNLNKFLGKVPTVDSFIEYLCE